MADFDKQQIEQKIGDPNVVVINVLDVEFYNNERIPGSKNAPSEAVDFIEQVSALASKDKSLLIYSQGADCPAAAAAARKLADEGYSHVEVLPGGLDAWKEAGGKLESDIPGAVG